jgi:hypothetical protein
VKLRSLVGAVLALVVAGTASASTSFSVFRASAFSTQATYYYCTAAVEQMIWNTATGASSHSATQQAKFYSYGRAHNRYAYPTRGVDPQGVAVTLNHFVPQVSWHVIRGISMQATLKAAAAAIRATGLPVVLFVGGGSHVWSMTGYTLSDSGAVAYVRFSGPLYPKQIAYAGWYDLAPNTQRSVSAFAQVFYRYSEHASFGDYRWTPWNGYFVAVVP